MTAEIGGQDATLTTSYEQEFEQSLGVLDTIDFNSNLEKFCKDFEITEDMNNTRLIATGFLNSAGVDISLNEWEDRDESERIFEYINKPLRYIEENKDEDIETVKEGVINIIRSGIETKRDRRFTNYLEEMLSVIDYSEDTLWQEILALAVIDNFKQGGFLQENSRQNALTLIARYGSAVRVLTDITFDSKA
jgi:hypothetical protein